MHVQTAKPEGRTRNQKQNIIELYVPIRYLEQFQMQCHPQDPTSHLLSSPTKSTEKLKIKGCDQVGEGYEDSTE